MPEYVPRDGAPMPFNPMHAALFLLFAFLMIVCVFYLRVFEGVISQAQLEYTAIGFAICSVATFFTYIACCSCMSPFKSFWCGLIHGKTAAADSTAAAPTIALAVAKKA